MSAGLSARRSPVRVLFLCTRSSARSQMAEALFVDASSGSAADQFEVASAGADPSVSIDPVTFDVLDLLGIDWRARTPKGFDAVVGAPWDVVITLCDGAREACPVLPGRPMFAHWPVDDPCAVDGPPAVRRRAFLRTAEHLRRCIAALLDVLAASDSGGGRPLTPVEIAADQRATERRVREAGGLGRWAPPAAP